MNRTLFVIGFLLLCSCVARADSLTLSPASQTLPVSTSATIDSTLDVTLTSAGATVFTVVLDVTSGPDTGETLSATDTCSGIVGQTCSFNNTFALVNDGTAGTDTISGAFSPNVGGGSVSPVTVTWTPLAAPEPGSVLLVAVGFLSLLILRLFR